MLRLAAGALCALSLAIASPVLAQEAQEAEAPDAKPRDLNGFFDALFVPKAELKVKDGSGLISSYPGFINSEGGSGRGWRARVPLPQGLFLQSEYQTNKYDGFDRGNTQPAEAKLFRGGIGFKHAELPLYGMLEIVHQDVEFGIIDRFSDGGFGAHVGAQGGARASYYAQLGFVDAGNFGNGVEYAVGGAYRLLPMLSVFADYRAGSQEDGALGTYEFADARVGLRINLVQGKKKKPRRTKEKRF